MWYVDTMDEVSGRHVLQKGPAGLEINMAEKKVTYESDRPTICSWNVRQNYWNRARRLVHS
jgi:hypothetical protein